PELEDESWQPPAGTEADPERTALDSERTRALSDALARITDDQRSAIVLYDVEGYDYAEIADMTGVSLGTVKSRIHRGRLALRGLLEDRMELFRGGAGPHGGARRWKRREDRSTPGPGRQPRDARPVRDRCRSGPRCRHDVASR